MKKSFLLGAFLAAYANAFSGNYKSLTCEGTMPQQMQHLLGTEKLQEHESDVRNIMKSGRVLYGTPINKYIDSIATNLFKANPLEDNEKIHIYLYKSADVNAFICKDGTLFMNLAMIAQATSEAELALVLSHEFSHFVRKHDASVSKKELRKSKDAVDLALKKSKQSRENESDADNYGISNYYKKTNYSYEAVPGLFDLLQYGYLPFDEEPFKREFFETSDFKFPDEYYLTKLKPIVSREDYVDTLDTHPNLKKRREAADNLVKNWSDEGRSEFMLSEASFDRARLMARKEVINYQLMVHRFGEAFYNAYVMLADAPNDVDLKTFVTQALYGMAKYADEGELKDVLPNYKDAEGESGAAYYFFQKLKKKELAVLALRYAWQTQQLNADVEPITRDLMRLVRSYKLSISDFCDFPMGTSVKEAQQKVDAKFGAVKPENAEIKAENTAVKADAKASKNKRGRKINTKTTNAVSGMSSTTTTTTTTTTASSQKKRDSKYDNIRQKQARESFVLPDSSFTVLNYMLVDLKSDSTFLNLMASSEKSDELKEVKSALDHATDKKVAFEGGKVLLVTYYFTDSKKAAKKDRDLQDNLIKWGAENGIDFVCYEQQLKQNPNTKNYNLCSYVEYMQLQNLITSGKGMVGMRNPELDSLLKQANVMKWLDVRVVDRTSKNFKMHGVAAGIAIPSALPAVVGAGFIKRRAMGVSALFKDIFTGNVDNRLLEKFKGYNSQPRLHNYLYNFIKNVRKGE